MKTPLLFRYFLLLAALALPTSGMAQVCGDVNGDGRVTVTDGVNVLRAAAGLPATLNCNPVPNPTATPGENAQCADGADCLQDGRFFFCQCPGAPFNPDCGQGGDPEVSKIGNALRVGRCETGQCRLDCSDAECGGICDSHNCGASGNCIPQ